MNNKSSNWLTESVDSAAFADDLLRFVGFGIGGLIDVWIYYKKR